MHRDTFLLSGYRIPSLISRNGSYIFRLSNSTQVLIAFSAVWVDLWCIAFLGICESLRLESVPEWE